MIIPMSEIHVDSSLNSRGKFTKHDIRTLIDSVRQFGQLQGGVVAPADDVVSWYGPLPEGKRYLLIAGFRRFAACNEVGLDSFEAIVKPNITTSTALKVLNAAENLERKDILPSEEIGVVQGLISMGCSDTTIANYLCRSIQWVTIRRLARELPKSAIDALDNGKIIWENVKELHKVRKNIDAYRATLIRMKETLESAGSVRAAKVKAESANAKHDNRDLVDFSGNRTKSEISGMISHLSETIGPNSHTIMLGWAVGVFTTRQALGMLPGYPHQSLGNTLRLGSEE